MVNWSDNQGVDVGDFLMIKGKMTFPIIVLYFLSVMQLAFAKSNGVVDCLPDLSAAQPVSSSQLNQAQELFCRTIPMTEEEWNASAGMLSENSYYDEVCPCSSLLDRHEVDGVLSQMRDRRIDSLVKDLSANIEAFQNKQFTEGFDAVSMFAVGAAYGVRYEHCDRILSPSHPEYSDIHSSINSCLERDGIHSLARAFKIDEALTVNVEDATFADILHTLSRSVISAGGDQEREHDNDFSVSATFFKFQSMNENHETFAANEVKVANYILASSLQHAYMEKDLTPQNAVRIFQNLRLKDYGQDYKVSHSDLSAFLGSSSEFDVSIEDVESILNDPESFQRVSTIHDGMLSVFAASPVFLEMPKVIMNKLNLSQDNQHALTLERFHQDLYKILHGAWDQSNHGFLSDTNNLCFEFLDDLTSMCQDLANPLVLAQAQDKAFYDSPLTQNQVICSLRANNYENPDAVKAASDLNMRVFESMSDLTLAGRGLQGTDRPNNNFSQLMAESRDNSRSSNSFNYAAYDQVNQGIHSDSIENGFIQGLYEGQSERNLTAEMNPVSDSNSRPLVVERSPQSFLDHMTSDHANNLDDLNSMGPVDRFDVGSYVHVDAWRSSASGTFSRDSDNELDSEDDEYESKLSRLDELARRYEDLIEKSSQKEQERQSLEFEEQIASLRKNLEDLKAQRDRIAKDIESSRDEQKRMGDQNVSEQATSRQARSIFDRSESIPTSFTAPARSSSDNEAVIASTPQTTSHSGSRSPASVTPVASSHSGTPNTGSGGSSDIYGPSLLGVSRSSQIDIDSSSAGANFVNSLSYQQGRIVDSSDFRQLEGEFFQNFFEENGDQPIVVRNEVDGEEILEYYIPKKIDGELNYVRVDGESLVNIIDEIDEFASQLGPEYSLDRTIHRHESLVQIFEELYKDHD